MDFEKEFLKETINIKIKNIEVLITDLLFSLYNFKTYEDFEKYVIKNMSYDIISSDFIIIKDDKKDILYFIKNQYGILHMYKSYKHEYCVTKSKGNFFEVEAGAKMDFEKEFLKETINIKIKNIEVLITDLLFSLYDFKTYEDFEKYVIKNMSYDIISSDFIIIKDDKKDILYFIKNQYGMLHMYKSYKHEYCVTKSKGNFFEVEK